METDHLHFLGKLKNPQRSTTTTPHIRVHRVSNFFASAHKANRQVTIYQRKTAGKQNPHLKTNPYSLCLIHNSVFALFGKGGKGAQE